METAKISRRMLQRLPLYLNYLKNLPEDADNISATAIAAALGLGHVMVRKDLAKVAHEGRRRTGRSRKQLIQDIESYLDHTSASTAILIGTGKLGLALLDHPGFQEAGLNVIAGFDSNPDGKVSDSQKPIYPMNRIAAFCKCYDVRIGILAVPAEDAQALCDELVACGIQAIWNFSPVHLLAPKHVVVISENLTVSINALRMQLKSRDSLHPVISDRDNNR
ncbi:MAG: redox-sensing transcriptional repressor Rex [Oscillospiraceae bacterium]|nr:redox-sensing transcriptional repressor Rex [Oscillospiraceae bacterium]